MQRRLRFFLLLGFSLLPFSGFHAKERSAEIPTRFQTLKSTEDENRLAYDLLSQVQRAAQEDEKIRISFLHLKSHGNDLEPRLKRTFELLVLLCDEKHIRHYLELDPILVEEEDMTERVNHFILASPEKNEIHKLVLEFERKTKAKLDDMSRKDLETFLKPAILRARFRDLKNRIFGLKKGPLIFSFFRNRSQDEVRQRNVKMNLISALVGVTMYSLATTVAWHQSALLKFGGSAHLASSVLLGSWLFWTLYGLPELSAMKSQGRSIFIANRAFREKNTSSPGENIQIRNNALTLNLFGFIEELVLYSGLSLTYELQYPGYILHPDTWFFVGAISLFATLAYCRSEFYFADKLTKVERMRGQAHHMSAIDSEFAKILEERAGRLEFKTFRQIFLWWNVIDTILTTGSWVIGSTFLSRQASDSMWSSVATALEENILLLPISVAGVGLIIWERKETIKARMSRLLKDEPSVQPCRNLLRLFRTSRLE